MKTLTIKEPWASLILRGGKDIENRTWNTKFRGEFFVHCSKTIDKKAYDTLGGSFYLPTKESIQKNLGAIIGVVELVDVVTESDSKWFQGPYGFVLKNPRRFENKHYVKGQLGFWEFTE